MPFIAEMSFEPGSERRSIQGSRNRDPPPPAWRCWTCHHDGFVWSFDDWICEQCGSMDYYDAAASLRRETDDGVWLYMPNHGNIGSCGLDTHADCSSLHRASNSRGFSNPSAPWWSTNHRPPHDDPEHYGHERAESEAATFDPSVDPDEPPQMTQEPEIQKIAWQQFEC